MEVIRSSETSSALYTTRCYNAEVRTLHSHRYGNVNPKVIIISSSCCSSGIYTKVIALQC
jgi:hypothetical protein